MAPFGLGLPLGVSGQAAQEEEESEEMSSTATSSCLMFQLLWHMVRCAPLSGVQCCHQPKQQSAASSQKGFHKEPEIEPVSPFLPAFLQRSSSK